MRSRREITATVVAGVLYRTDRGDPPRGNTVNRAPMDADGKPPEILYTHLMEGIGIALDVKRQRMFLTDLGGSIYSARMDGSGKKTLLYAQGNCKVGTETAWLDDRDFDAKWPDVFREHSEKPSTPHFAAE